MFERFKYRLYDGILYPALGSKYAYTSREIQIEYSTYIHFGNFFTEFMLKTKLKNPSKPYRLEALCKIQEAGYVLKQFFGYMGDPAKHKDKEIEIIFDPSNIHEYAKYMNRDKPIDHYEMVIVYTKDGEYIGDPKQAMWLIFNGITNLYAPDGKHCRVGYQASTKKWVGWNSYMSASFGLHDAEFDPTATIEDTMRLFGIQYNSIEEIPFNKRGFDICENDDECKQAAINFANY